MRDSLSNSSTSHLSRNKRMGLEALVIAGVSHRRMVEDLQASDAVSIDGFEWLRQIRHYWDPDANDGCGGLLIMFSQTRLQYGFEYDGKQPHAVPQMLLATENGLLSAINALQTSPLVTLGLPSRGPGHCKEVVASLSTLAGKLHLSFDLSSNSTSLSISSMLSTALKCDAWLVVDGAESISHEVLAVFSSQIYRIWQSFFFGTGHVNLHGLTGKDSDPPLTPSPWDMRQKWQTRSHAVQCWGPCEGPGMSCAIFISIPITQYLAPCHEFVSSTAHSRATLACSHLSEALRRTGRMISIPLSLSDPGPGLEAGLKSMGLRDAAEAAKCASCVIKFSQLQLQSRPHYFFGLRLVRGLISYITSLWLPSYLSGEGCDLHPGNALDAMEQALRVTLVGMCEGQEDAQLVTRLIEQVFASATKTPAANVGESCDNTTNSVCPSTVNPLQLQGLVNFMCSSSAANSVLPLNVAPSSPSRATSKTIELSSPLPAKSASRLAKDSKATAPSNGASASGHQLNPGLPSAPPAALQHSSSGSFSLSLSKPVPQALLQAASKEILGQAVVSLHSALFSSESSHACFLVGSAGSGKTFLWKTLISALHAAGQGCDAGCIDDALSESASVIRIFPETMPLLTSLANSRVMFAARGPPAPSDIFHELDHNPGPSSSIRFDSLQIKGDISDSWLSPLLEGTHAFNLSSSETPMLASSGLRSWVVVDGPLGTSSADSLTPFLQADQVHVGADIVVGLRRGAKLIWECDALLAASPALLSSIPIVFVPSSILVSMARGMIFVSPNLI